MIFYFFSGSLISNFSFEQKNFLNLQITGDLLHGRLEACQVGILTFENGAVFTLSFVLKNGQYNTKLMVSAWNLAAKLFSVKRRYCVSSLIVAQNPSNAEQWKFLVLDGSDRHRMHGSNLYNFRVYHESDTMESWTDKLYLNPSLMTRNWMKTHHSEIDGLVETEFVESCGSF